MINLQSCTDLCVVNVELFCRDYLKKAGGSAMKEENRKGL